MAVNRKTILFYVTDILLVTFSFLLFIYIKPESVVSHLPYYYYPYLVFLSIWLAASIPIRKYSLKGKNSLGDFLSPVLHCILISLGMITFMVVVNNQFIYSKTIVFGTIFLAGFSELLLFSLYYYYRKLNRISENKETILAYLAQMEKMAEAADRMQLQEPANLEHYPVFTLLNYRDQIVEESGEPAYNFMCSHVNETLNRTLVLSTTSRFNIDSVPSDVANVIVNLKLINDLKRVNKFFESVNSKLPVGGLFIDSVVTTEIKKKRIMWLYPWGVNYLFYSLYYIFKRVFPKLPLLKKIYFLITNGFDRSISEAETFGRLYSCGFEVVTKELIASRLYFVARKLTEPAFDMNPTYGLLISLKRVGKNGRPIHVYKIRTMHPYSEYLQQYVSDTADPQDISSLKDDFRISAGGRLMRRTGIDKLPMLLNILIGDIKLIGVKPLSQQALAHYTKELQKERQKFKPGLISVTDAGMPGTMEEIMASERLYLEAYEKHPVLTDLKYLGKELNNFLFKRKRSR